MHFRNLNLDALNSATKYPSILTYHGMGDRGRLSDEVMTPPEGETLFVSEKVDGTNTRILVNEHGEFLVGSRNDFLWYSGDLLYNPAQSIVDVVREVAPNMEVPKPGRIRVYFGESYGGKISSQSKQYTTQGAVDFKLFDIVEFEEAPLMEILSKPPEEISLWRENGGQPFWNHADLVAFGFPLTPRVLTDTTLPTGHREVLDWLENLLPRTQCNLDKTGQGEPEGVVVRNADRSFIAKIRYQDYRRTIKR